VKLDNSQTSSPAAMSADAHVWRMGVKMPFGGGGPSGALVALWHLRGTVAAGRNRRKDLVPQRFRDAILRNQSRA
jgi:hypothetical protein